MRVVRACVCEIGKINQSKLANYLGIDIFCLVACPENSLIDSKVCLSLSPSLSLSLLLPLSVSPSLSHGLSHSLICCVCVCVSVCLCVIGKINQSKLANYLGIDILCLVACPENSLIDSKVCVSTLPFALSQDSSTRIPRLPGDGIGASALL